MRKTFFLIVSVLLLSCSEQGSESVSAVSNAGPTVAEQSARFIGWLDEQYTQELNFSPLTKTRLGDKSDYALLDDVSEAAEERQLQWRRDSVASMHESFAREQLDRQGQISWDLWEYYLADEERNAQFRRHGYIFGRNGPQSGLPASLINNHRVDSIEDMQAYISRLNQSNRFMLQYLERAKLAAADDIRAPFFDYQRAMTEIERITTGRPFTEVGESALWTDITAKIGALLESGAVDSQLAVELTTQARESLLGSFKPAYDEVLAWLRADFENVSIAAEGAWVLPNGMNYYHVRLRSMTTLPLSASELHETGLAEVARIQAEMEDIKRQVGFNGSLQEFFTFMRDDDQFYLPNTDFGREQYIRLAEEYLAAMRPRLSEYFGLIPQAPLQVKRVEAFREEDGGAAFYSRSTPDGSRPGTFYVHLSDMRASTVTRLENLVYHEGLPGHHMQIAIQQELESLPRFRANKGFTAYSEGWGLYAEYLGAEMGFYRDPYAQFGRLSGEIWRAVRLVVDTGIHAMYWTQEQAEQYAMENSPRPRASVISEIQRYYNNPGQAVAYKIGQLKLMELRARAEAALGDQFDIRAFHDTVLGSGALPMSLLEIQIDQWIASQL
jgi:uncharacterized protein (DUF885 family)